MSKKILITQSNYIPWKGYIDAVIQSDYYVVFDEMQYTRRDWRNRNQIKTPNGLQWLTIPVEVKGKYSQKINETKIADKSWAEKHWKSLIHNYSKAKYFQETKSVVEEWYQKASRFDFLTDVNVYFLQEILQFLDYHTEVHFSKNFDLLEGKTERLVSICKELGGTDYYTGSAAKAYMNEDLFYKEGINVHYLDYSCYEEYQQLHGVFVHEVSILDMIFNLGKNTKQYLKSTK